MRLCDSSLAGPLAHVFPPRGPGGQCGLRLPEAAHVPPRPHAFPQGCTATGLASSSCPPPPCSVPPSRTRTPAAPVCPQPRTVPGDFLTGFGEQGDPGPCGHQANPLASLPTATQSFLWGGAGCPAACSQPAPPVHFVCWAVPCDPWFRHFPVEVLAFGHHFLTF